MRVHRKQTHSRTNENMHFISLNPWKSGIWEIPESVGARKVYFSTSQLTPLEFQPGEGI